MTLHTRMNRAGKQLCEELAPLRFSRPVTHVYNPLAYARAAHELYVSRFGHTKKRVLLMGMNPGPFGMAQTGIPFGDAEMVRTWLGIDVPIEKPLEEHPKRLVQGFSCPRSEVSGKRLWSAVAGYFEAPESFFNDFFIINYCPLVFMEASGKNRTPDKLPSRERAPVFAACDRYVRRAAEIYEPEWIIGIGAFAQKRIQEGCAALLEQGSFRAGGILHPSPANPKANAGWAGQARTQLSQQGVCRCRR